MFSSLSLGSLNLRQGISQIPSIGVIRNPYTTPVVTPLPAPSVYVAPTTTSTPVPISYNSTNQQQAIVASTQYDVSSYLPYLAIVLLGYFLLDK